MVTHHLEEIPPGITHAVLLRAGQIMAAGPIAETLTSEAVSDTFGLAVVVDTDGRRYSARLAPT
jgi:iron complex transport system ATP-binding protein